METEKSLFYQVRAKAVSHDGDCLTDNYHIYDISTEDYEGYRCDNKEIGSFEVFKYPDKEICTENGISYHFSNEPDYQFNGHYHDDFPDVTIEQAYEIIN